MTQPAAAFEGYDPLSTSRGKSFTAPFNVTGLPAISVPCGFTESGLPIGMQIAGKPFDEPGVIQAAYTYQQYAGWHQLHPEI
jgi:aspartyl-tRNA(Asn)/glutamyl-tRNA(Gln) amidotransferase subunit A